MKRKKYLVCKNYERLAEFTETEAEHLKEDKDELEKTILHIFPELKNITDEPEFCIEEIKPEAKKPKKKRLFQRKRNK